MILHIDGVTNARLIAIKAEVDMEMVRACLRVLKHHGVISLVDMFLYSNRYEFTARASAMLAGKEPNLLQDAIDFCIKASPRLSNTASFHIPANAATTDTISQTSSSPSGMAHHYTIPVAAGGSERSESDSSHHPTGPPSTSSNVAPQDANLATSPYNGLLSSSYPPKTFLAAGSHRSPNYKFAMMAANSLDRDPFMMIVPRSKEEHRNLKLAIAELYCACNRNLSFGDLWITLTAPEVSVSNDNANTSGDESLSLALPNLRTPSYGQSRGATASVPSSHQIQGKRSTVRSSRTSSSDFGGSDQSDPFDGVALSPLETNHLEGLRARTAGTPGCAGIDNAVDWADAFNRFDHRRFASFGVVHGLLRRVHNYPYFPGVFPDPPPDASSSSPPTVTTTATFVTSNMGCEQEHSNNNSVQHTSDTSKQSKRESSRAKEMASYRLSRKVASLMDGTRCDDELVCKFEKPFQQLVGLVENYGRRKIVSVFATAYDG